MNEWKVFNGRISLFLTMPPSASVPSAVDLYRQIWGSEPDLFQKQSNVLAPMLAQGLRDGLVVDCVTQPARIDFNIKAASSPETLMTMAVIDHPSAFFNELKRIIDIFDKSSPSIDASRVALNLHFLNLSTSHTNANKALAEVIPARYGVTMTNEEDFIFQINEPKPSKEIEDIRMNIITKWSVDNIQILSISLPTGGVAMGTAGMTSSQAEKTFVAAHVVFDNNNTPSRRLTGKEQTTLLHEAFDTASGMQRAIGLKIEGF